MKHIKIYEGYKNSDIIGNYICDTYLSKNYRSLKIKERETRTHDYYFYCCKIGLIKERDILNEKDFKIFLEISEFFKGFASVEVSKGQSTGEFTLVITFNDEYKYQEFINNNFELSAIKYNL
jgi:hypothetical protein